MVHSHKFQRLAEVRLPTDSVIAFLKVRKNVEFKDLLSVHTKNTLKTRIVWRRFGRSAETAPFSSDRNSTVK